MFQCQYTCRKKKNKKTKNKPCITETLCKISHHLYLFLSFLFFTFGYNSSIHKQICTIVGKLDPWKSLMIERTISIMEHFKPSIINIICHSNSFFGMKEIYGKEWNKKRHTTKIIDFFPKLWIYFLNYRFLSFPFFPFHFYTIYLFHPIPFSIKLPNSVRK